MKYCKKCDIKILDELEYCPLCRSALCPIKELDPLDAARIRLLKEDEKRLDAREEELRGKREEFEAACGQRDREIQASRESAADKRGQEADKTESKPLQTADQRGQADDKGTASPG